MEQEYPFVILVIDDEPPISDVLTHVAKDSFPEAVFINVRSAGETMDYLDQHPNNLPQLVLLDIDLHQYPNGLDLLPELHARFRGLVPIVMLTVSQEQDAIRKAIVSGAVAFTRKPDDLAGWKAYATMLRQYWYQTARVPTREDVD
ncbi:response regulator [Spirosoma rhododendri]|uniref:Response regulator n=1 Tax=Spirosoma rhododendri TaxID=2728024 RepID=A0A7L5DM59_9BACT|nr:response regulator [Spirosoma rhododendri]QJD79496.1 response regulator [Spirosoma rhododendri]